MELGLWEEAGGRSTGTGGSELSIIDWYKRIPGLRYRSFRDETNDLCVELNGRMVSTETKLRSRIWRLEKQHTLLRCSKEIKVTKNFSCSGKTLRRTKYRHKMVLLGQDRED